MYMHMLIMYRDSFPRSGCHDRIIDGIRKKLLKKNVLATSAELRAFRQNLQKQHRNRKRAGITNHVLHLPCSVIFDGADKQQLNGTEYDISGIQEEDAEEDNFNNALLKFSTG